MTRLATEGVSSRLLDFATAAGIVGGMIQTVKKMLGLCLMACIAAMLAPINATAEAEEQQTDKMLQPQGLNYAGIYALRQLDPNLTGSGVKFAVISRSITYIDGEP